LSEVEEYLFVRWSRQLDPGDPVFSNVIARARRSVDPAAGGDAAARAARQAKLNLLRKDVLPMDGVDPRQTYPSLQRPDSEVGLLFSKAMLERFQEKVVRGAAFKLYKRLIAPGLTIRYFDVHETDIGAEVAALESQLTKFELGAGFEIAHGQATDDDQVLLLRVTIWGIYRFYAVVAPEGFYDGADD
jgi:hypothetical protein